MKSPLEQPIDKIRQDCLLLFKQSVGWEFRVKGTQLIDICDGIDLKYQHVIGLRYGNFHIDLCELTGREKQIKES